MAAKSDASYTAGAAAGNIHSVSDSCDVVSDDYRGLCFELCGAVSADYGGIYLLLDKGAFPFHGLCADSVDLGSVLSFAESAAEVAVYFSGALLSTSFWMLYSVFFSYYVDHMGNYSVIYGSIGAIIAFLIWLNLSLTALLLGAVFNQALRETAAHEKLLPKSEDFTGFFQIIWYN